MTVADCMDDFRTELREDVQNMHLELIRQFEIQRVRSSFGRQPTRRDAC